MDVKEVTNSAVQLFLNKIAGAAPQEGGSEMGFSSLLGDTASSVLDIIPSGGNNGGKPSAAVEGRHPIKTEKNTSKAKRVSNRDDIKPAVEKSSRDKSSSKEVSKPEDKAVGATNIQQSAPKEEKTAASASVVESSLPTAAKNIDYQPAATSVEAPAAGGVAVPEASGGKLNIFMTEVNGKSTGYVEAALMLQGVGAVIANGSIALTDPSVTLEALAAMPEIKVLQEDGSFVTMTGAELAAQVQGLDEAPALQQVPLSDVVKLAKIPEEVAVEAAHLTQNAAAESKAAAGVQNTVYEDAATFAQAALLDEKMPADAKVKIEVKVNEEKISYRQSGDLLQDRLSIDETVQKVMDGDKNKTLVSPHPAQSQSAQSATPVNPAQNSTAQNGQPVSSAAALNAAPIAAPVADADDVAANAASVKTAAVTEINTAALSRAGAGGSEFVNNAKAEALAKNESSTRDIYKGMSKEVIDQVKVNITKSAVKGVDKIDVRLKPEDLGHIEIKMQISKDGKLQAHIISSRPETMEVLQKEIQNLEKAFNDAGFQTDEGSLSFSFREGNQAGQEQDRNSELRNYIGNVFENEAKEELVGNDNLLNWNPAQGLNIRV